MLFLRQHALNALLLDYYNFLIFEFNLFGIYDRCFPMTPLLNEHDE
jgi:hypothetical protein